MARRKKRLEKKLRRERQAWIDRAESLFLKGEDEAFLASVRRRGEDVPEELRSAYDEVRGRVVRRALSRANLEAVEDELAHGAAPTTEGGDATPALAQALLHFVHGDDESARKALRDVPANPPENTAENTAADAVEDTASLFVPLRSALAALVGQEDANTDDADTDDTEDTDTDALPQATRDLVAGFRQLRSVEHAASTGGALSRDSIDDDDLEAARSMIVALGIVRHRDHMPGQGTVARLVAACNALADRQPGADALEAIAQCKRRGRLLQAVLETEKKVRVARGAAARRTLDGLSDVADELALLDETPPAPAVAVHYALRRRLQALLHRVADAEGGDGLVTVAAAIPPLGGELRIGDRPLTLDDPRLEAQRLRMSLVRPMGARFDAPLRRPSEDVERIGRLVRAEEDPLRRAQLIQVELEMRHEALGAAADPREAGSRARAFLRRVEHLAPDLATMPSRIAGETARLVRGDLADLTLLVPAGEEWRRSAEALLDVLPGDPFLLAFAVAGARAAGDVTAVERLGRAIEAASDTAAEREPRGVDPGKGEDPYILLVEGLAPEETPVIDAGLGALRKLLPETAWVEYRRHAARSFREQIVHQLPGLAELNAMSRAGGPMSLPIDVLVADIRRHVGAHVGGEPEFEAALTIVSCLDADAGECSQRVESFWQRFPDLPARLSLHSASRGLHSVAHVSVYAQSLPRILAKRVVESIEPGDPGEWISSVLDLADDLHEDGLEELRLVVQREYLKTVDPKLRDLLQRLEETLHPDWSAPVASPFGSLFGRSRPKKPKRPKKKPAPRPEPDIDQMELF